MSRHTSHTDINTVVVKWVHTSHIDINTVVIQWMYTPHININTVGLVSTHTSHRHQNWWCSSDYTHLTWPSTLVMVKWVDTPQLAIRNCGGQMRTKALCKVWINGLVAVVLDGFFSFLFFGKLCNSVCESVCVAVCVSMRTHRYVCEQCIIITINLMFV